MMYRATVVANNDPAGLGRVRLLIPAVLGEAVSGWGYPMPATGGEVPAVGAVVWASFDSSDFTTIQYIANDQDSTSGGGDGSGGGGTGGGGDETPDPTILDPSVIADAISKIGTSAATGTWGTLGNGPWTPSTYTGTVSVTLGTANAASTLSGYATSWDRMAISIFSKVRWLGPDMVPATTTEVGGPQGALKSAPMTTTPQLSRALFEFETDADAFEVMLYCVTTNSMGYRIWVDDQPVHAPQVNLGSGASTYRIKVDFTAASNPGAWKRIKVEANNARLIRMVMAPDKTMMPPGTRRRPRCIVIGDSHTEGSGGTWTWTSWPMWMGQRLGWNVCNMGVGGTGYVNMGSAGRTNFLGRIADIPGDADFIIVAGGYSDKAYAPADVRAAANTYYQELKKAHPNSRIIVLSQFVSAEVTTSGTETALRDAIKAAAIDNGLPFIDLVGYPNPDTPCLISGTGKSGSPTGNGNADRYVASDGVHYTAAGYEFIGNFVASRIQDFFTGFGPPASTPPVVIIPTPEVPETPPALTGPYPIDMSPTVVAALKAATPKVFAHYMGNSNLNRSIDNKDASVDWYTTQYMRPTGESGKWAFCYSFIRDRPLPRPVIGSSQWKLEDARWEIARASESGLDGFVILFAGFGAGSNYDQSITILQAAAAQDPNFKIMLQVDCNGTGVYPLTAVQMAAEIKKLCSYSSVYKLPDGRVLFSPHYAQRMGSGTSTQPSVSVCATFWKDFMAEMARLGQPLALMPVFADERPYLSSFAPFTYGMSNWGSGVAGENSPINSGSGSRVGRILAAKAAGYKWMQPVRIQDVRPRSSLFSEALNTTNYRNTWQIAIDGQADFVQLATWNDWTEGSNFAPSMYRGFTQIDMLPYYISWFKNGTPPTIGQDVIFMSHRNQFNADIGLYRPSDPAVTYKPMLPNGTASPPRDHVEALLFLTADATVRFTVGGVVGSPIAVQAGVRVVSVPLVASAAGTLKAEIIRNGTTIATATSPWQVYANGQVPYQDEAYRFVSSARGS